MDDELVIYGGEIKALGNGKVGGVLVRVTNQNEPDLANDYFSSQSDVRFPSEIDVYYNHGMDETIKKRVIGRAKLSRLDNADVWAETQLNMRDEYEKRIYELAEAGKLGYSSGALSHLVEREPVGKSYHIKTWVIGEASLTPTPAEYRNTVRTIKSITLETADAVQEIKMETNEIKSEIEQGIKAALEKKEAEAKAEAEKQAAIKAAEDKGYAAALEDVKSRKAPAFNTKTELGFSEEKDAVPAFKHWVQTGQVNGALIAPDSSYNIKAAFNQTTGASGGYLVPDPLYNQIIAKRNLASWVRQLPVQIFSTPSDHLLVPVEDTSHTAFVLTAEAGAYNEDEGTIAQKDLILYKYTKLIKASEEFMMNQGTNFDSWLTNALARAEAVTENTAFTTGTGSGQPQGIVTGATAGNTTATTDVILPAELTGLLGYLGAGYNVPSECGLLMNNATKWYLAGYTGNPFLYQNTPAGSPDNLFGYPVVVDDDVVTYTTASSKCIVFGNFNFFGVVEKPGMLVQRNPYLYMANGQVGIFANIYRGSAVLQSEAFYYLTNHS
jgi:HK97 family phage major capsid protein